jgi:drug/metabolite transporter (DMT)-like permease
MSWLVFAAALASAGAHASWNVLAKKQHVPSDAVLGIILATACVCLAALPFIGLPPATAWLWLVTAAIFNIAYSRALMAAYDRSKLSLIYSTVRAIVPPMLFIAGLLFFSESAHVTAIGGLALIILALMLFGMQDARTPDGDHRGLLLAVGAGLVLSVSYACDIKGARATGGGLLGIFQYGAVSSLATAGGLLALSLVERKNPLAILRRNWLACGLGSALLMASYFLALWAYVQGPIGLVAPIRETSILFGGLLAFLVLHERIGPRQWAAIGLAAFGAVLIKIK